MDNDTKFMQQLGVIGAQESTLNAYKGYAQAETSAYNAQVRSAHSVVEAVTGPIGGYALLPALKTFGTKALEQATGTSFEEITGSQALTALGAPIATLGRAIATNVALGGSGLSGATNADFAFGDDTSLGLEDTAVGASEAAGAAPAVQAGAAAGGAAEAAGGGAAAAAGGAEAAQQPIGSAIADMMSNYGGRLDAVQEAIGNLDEAGQAQLVSAMAQDADRFTAAGRDVTQDLGPSFEYAQSNETGLTLSQGRAFALAERHLPQVEEGAAEGADVAADTADTGAGAGAGAAADTAGAAALAPVAADAAGAAALAPAAVDAGAGAGEGLLSTVGSAVATGARAAAGATLDSLGAVGTALDAIPGGQLIGGLIGLGTILAGVFGHKHEHSVPRHDPNAPIVANVSTQFGV